MLLTALPISSPYDPVEDPPGSIDPLGTVAMAEQLADVLLPGLTARMWRIRHLTFTALAALLGERAASAEGSSEEIRLEARLGLERLFVSAVAWKDEKKEDNWGNAARRLPGIGLARRAIRSGHQPLGKQNFLKGQAINGPFGVVQRLARNLDIIDDDNQLSRNGEALLLAWSAERGLWGIFDESNSDRRGAKWLRRLTRDVVNHVKQEKWPNKTWWGWSDLPVHLRPDEPGKQESEVLFQLLAGDANVVRKRCINLLLSPEILSSYRVVAETGSRGTLDRMILAQQMDARVLEGGDEVDKLIQYTVALIEAFEQVSGYADSAFRGLMWALTRRGGRGTPSQLLGDSVLALHLKATRQNLSGVAERFQTLMTKILDYPQVVDAVSQERLDQLMHDALDGLASEQMLVDAVMDRHKRVQRQKRKGVWIEQDHPNWILMPGFGDSSDAPPNHNGAYLHPFRVSNAYSFLSDLGKVEAIEVPNGEEE
ncbi:hypothetical protein M4951_06165 [Blastopirellula sp. J2-11]|uniref:hypothetical protein n=1 Tax=Blastopirellula sp. J2-11 TaxID=2943192 RepID=UPI0021C6FD28|nr:hypothetical protein [Blastopirellula sp. J2-11]UUO07896.1 hypothetical protein M4951_06165 [Blastopirellula sp. J2-11]